jgi:4-hydroxy-3-polyprenylbenzoate decarboxylase
MGYRNLRECLDDLRRTNQLVEIPQEVDPKLEAAAIQRRVCAAGGPALYFSRLKGTSFPAVGNLFGTIERTRYLFRDTLQTVRRLIELKSEPDQLARRPGHYVGLAPLAFRLVPKHFRNGPVFAHEARIEDLPAIKSWPRDGGPFVTLPAVYTEDPAKPGWRHSNLGMYRVQLAGGCYVPNREVGLHYQIHRGIGIHHSAAIERGEALRVNVIVGGPPALAMSAVMPLPEGLPELVFAAALGGRRLSLAPAANGLCAPVEADFVISGTIDPKQTKPEGPFGDHLGYYSLAHEFPVLQVDRVHHRAGAIWPFTSVGRPPQEDTAFGSFIHELVGPAVSRALPGVHAVHAVDAAGVHPLLLAQGSERYVPYMPRRRPQEILTQACAILGQGQMSLAKYLFIVAREDNPDLDLHDLPAVFRHVLERVDWSEDLHFFTRTTIDTLDYSGHGFNAGSKLIIAAVGEPRRVLPVEVPGSCPLPAGFREPKLALPGIIAIKGPPFEASGDDVEPGIARFTASLGPDHPFAAFPLVLVVDDSAFVASRLENVIWVTRSDPAADVHGGGARTWRKHWGCIGPLVIDARAKPHHAPVLEEDPEVARRVDALSARGGPLHGVI